jgi:hypothetical protein
VSHRVSAKRRIVDAHTAFEHVAHADGQCRYRFSSFSVSDDALDSARPESDWTDVGANIAHRFHVAVRVCSSHPFGNPPFLSCSDEEPGVVGYATAPTCVVSINERLRAICVECDSGEAEESPRAGIFVGEANPEWSGVRLTSSAAVEIGESENGIHRKRRHRDAVSGDRVQRGVDGADHGEFADQCRIDAALVRRKPGRRIEPVGDDDARRSLSIDRVQAVENSAVYIRSRCRLEWDTRSVERNDLGFGWLSTQGPHITSES